MARRRSRLRGVLAIAAALVAACTNGVSTQAPATGNEASAVAGTAAPATQGTTPGVPAATSPDATPVGPGATLPATGTWARIEIDGPAPAPREDHTWTVDPDRNVAYVFGGRDGGTVFDDLWAFDFATDTWRRMTTAGETPPPRFGHEAVWWPAAGLVVWAGQAGATFYDDLWLFEPALAEWRRLPSEGVVPLARYGSCSGIGPDGRLWISHGFTADGIRFADTKAYSFESGRWTDEAPAGTGPIERCLHACWWTGTGQFVLYGGQTTGVAALGDLWFLTPRPSGGQSHTWAEAPDQDAAPRQLAAVGRVGSLTVLVGGRDKDREPRADTWLLLDGQQRLVRLETPGTTPPARSGATLVHDAARDRLVLFGGIGEDALDDVWELRFPD